MNLRFDLLKVTLSATQRKKQRRLSVTAPFLSNYAHQSHVALQKHEARMFFFALR